MAGIATIAKQLKLNVRGCDANIYPPMSDALIDAGITLDQGYKVEHISAYAPDLVIIGNAMSRGNECVEYVLNQKIPYTSGPQWLLENVLTHKKVLAVAGTHGKTTSSSILAWILESNDLNPGFLIGGIPKNFNISARLTDSDYFVIEADEYDTAFFDKRSKFLHYHPDIFVLNNLEFDHADIFDSLEDIKKQFEFGIRTVPENGTVIYPATSNTLQYVISRGCWSDKFELNKDITIANNSSDFSNLSICHQNKTAYINWNYIGEHNANNALAAISASLQIGLPLEAACAAVNSFQGVKRRQEVRAIINDITIIDDFAHHPSAIKQTLHALKQKSKQANLIAIVQFGSNTMRMGAQLEQLKTAFDDADLTIMLDPNDPHWDLAEFSNNLACKHIICTDVDEIIDKTIKRAKPGDYIAILSNKGFGNIHQKLIDKLNETTHCHWSAYSIFKRPA